MEEEEEEEEEEVKEERIIKRKRMERGREKIKSRMSKRKSDLAA